MKYLNTKIIHINKLLMFLYHKIQKILNFKMVTLITDAGQQNLVDFIIRV